MNKVTWLLAAAAVSGLALHLLRDLPDPTLERVAELEHLQWMEWSKNVAPEVSPERRARWKQHWVPYDQLPEEVKELDREWARKVIREVKR